MDESTNSRHVDEGKPADTDSQAVESRGRLGQPRHTGPPVDPRRAPQEEPVPAETSASEPTTDTEARPSPPNGDPVPDVSGDDREDDASGDDLEHDEPGGKTGKHDGGEPPASERSFLLGLAWWP